MPCIVSDWEKRRRGWFVLCVFLMLTILQIMIISMFSAQPAKVSTGVSNKVVDNLKFVPESVPRHSNEAKEGQISLSYIIRKMAHFYNFAVLGLLLETDRKMVKNDYKGSIIFAIAGLLVAVFDEFHQYFVPGRSMEITDMVVDFSGVLFGMCFIEVVFWFVFDRRNNGRREKY